MIRERERKREGREKQTDWWRWLRYCSDGYPPTHTDSQQVICFTPCTLWAFSVSKLHEWQDLSNVNYHHWLSSHMCWHAARGGNPDLCVDTDWLLWVHLVAITLVLMLVIATVTVSKLFTHMYNHTYGLPYFISAQLSSMWWAEVKCNLFLPVNSHHHFSKPSAANNLMYSTLSLPENCLVPINRNPPVLTAYTSACAGR